MYIDETGRRLGDHVPQHLRDIWKNAFTSDVATHFNSLNHVINDFSVRVVTSIAEFSKRKLSEGTLREEDSSHMTHWYSYIHVYVDMYVYLHVFLHICVKNFLVFIIYIYLYVYIFL